MVTAADLSALKFDEDNSIEQDASNFYSLNGCNQLDIPVNDDNEIDCYDPEKSKCLGNFNEFFTSFTHRIASLHLNDKTNNQIYELCGDLLKQTQILNKNIFTDDQNSHPSEVLGATSEFVRGKLEEQSTAYRRQILFENNELFVPCNEYTLGVKYEMIRDKITKIATPRYTQCKFQYISIVDSLKSLFKRQDFWDAYFEYNSNRHTCKPGVYIDVCCGSMFQNNELFQKDPLAIRLHIANDDFEICNPLGSKATMHKLSAFYFTVQNMPPQFRSKLDNIFPFCICYSDDLKTKYTDINDIWRVVKKDISSLETKGITVGDFTIRGTIVYVSFDNLGANLALGFVGCFVSTYYCRFCEMSITECRTKCREDRSKMRTLDSYNKALKCIRDSTKVDFKQTRGIKMKCVLNELIYWHMLINRSVDIMHDLNEGIIPFAIKQFFLHLIKFKMLTEEQISKMVQFFDYGFLNQRNIPSHISLERSNLGQNATQNLCLLQNIPFIFWEFRKHPKLKDLWICIESLLNICNICYSSDLNESDLDRLRKETEIHFNCLKKLGLHLLPKHHFLLHYARIIEEMGPLVFMSMFRFESKHKTLKSYMNDNSNFQNVTYTIARKHQEYLAGVRDSYINKFFSGSEKDVPKELIDSHFDLFSECMLSNESLKKEVQFLKFCDKNYKKGLFVFEENKLNEIIHILRINDSYYFICSLFDILNFNEMLNSFEIDKTNSSDHNLIEFSSLKHKNVYEKKHLDSKFYIICDSLYLKKCLNY